MGRHSQARDPGWMIGWRQTLSARLRRWGRRGTPPPRGSFRPALEEFEPLVAPNDLGLFRGLIPFAA